MKRRYKLLIIIIIGSIMAILIHNDKKNDKVTLVAIGDSLSVALTPYGVNGTSFTDYLYEELSKQNKLKNYNYDYSYNHLTIKELNELIEKNNVDSGIPIKQLLSKANVITIAIGIDELADISIKRDIDNEDINNYITEYEIFLQSIREFYHNRIYLIGLYQVYSLTRNNIIDLNKKLRILSGKYNAYFIDIFPYTLDKDYYFSNDNYFLNYRIHKKISSIILNSLKI